MGSKAIPRAYMMLPVCVFALCLVSQACGLTGSSPKAQVVYEWVSLDYDWQNHTTKADYIASGKYIKGNNIIAGVKVYKGDVYVTVPRWREGVPASLNKVVLKSGRFILQPFPDWGSQAVGDCAALQYVHSMEIDPQRGWMWIIDIGRLDILPGETPRNLCPPKILIYDINNRRYIKRYTFPESVASHSSNFLNDIVVDIVNGKPSYAYITDTSFVEPGLVVYDFQKNTSHRFTHQSMAIEPGAENVTINNVTYVMAAPIDGIALSADSKFVYYCALAGYSLFQVPTNVLRNPRANFGDALRNVGRKASQSDGLAYGQKNLYYAVLENNAVYKWEVDKDAEAFHGYDNVKIKTETPLISDDAKIPWADTFAFDDRGYLWFTANNLQPFFAKTMDFSDTNTVPNVRIWKVFIGEKGYLHHPKAVSTIVG